MTSCWHDTNRLRPQILKASASGRMARERRVGGNLMLLWWHIQSGCRRQRNCHYALSRGKMEAFLESWSRRAYTNVYQIRSAEKHFGLSRATTLLHFLSGGRLPIFDSRVRRSMNRLLGSPVLNTVPWYLDSYCPAFSEMAALCDAQDLRTVDMALFSYSLSPRSRPSAITP